jgi:hypothetical protein
MAEELDHLLFPVVEINQVLIMPHYFKALIELFRTVLTRHISLEISEAASCDVYHFFLAHALLNGRRSATFLILAHSTILFRKSWRAFGFGVLVFVSIFLIRSRWHVVGCRHHVLIVLALIGVVLDLG